MPQTNLYFFDTSAMSAAVFWLVGYGVFYRYVVGRLMLVHVSRHFLSSAALRRLNPLQSVGLCPYLFISEHRIWKVTPDFFYLEGFLFGVEFILLAVLVVRFLSPAVRTQEAELRFELRSGRDSTDVGRRRLTSLTGNLVRGFVRGRSTLFYPAGADELSLLTRRVLEEVLRPYDRQPWLVRVYESFFEVIKETAEEELALDPELADE